MEAAGKCGAERLQNFFVWCQLFFISSEIRKQGAQLRESGDMKRKRRCEIGGEGMDWRDHSEHREVAEERLSVRSRHGWWVLSGHPGPCACP